MHKFYKVWNKVKASVKQMKNQKKIITGISIIFALSLLMIAGCTEQQPQNNTDADNNPNSEINETKTILATVNDEEITEDDVTEMQQSYAQQGQELNEKEALEQVINQTLLLQQVKQGNYMLTDNATETELERYLVQQNSSLAAYKQQLAQQGISYKKHLQTYKEQLSIEIYLNEALAYEQYNISDEQAETQLQEYLVQQNSTLKEYKQLLSQRGYSYEEQLLNYKESLKRQFLIQTLREDAVIEYQ